MESLIRIIKELKGRPSWTDYFISVAYLISKRSSCGRLHVGCVIVKDNRIISTGYNGHIQGTAHVSVVVDGHEQMTIHAETNAISHAAKTGVSLDNTVAYVTHYPCINCTKNLISSGIRAVVYAEDYNNNPLCQELYKMSKITVEKYATNN